MSTAPHAASSSQPAMESQQVVQSSTAEDEQPSTVAAVSSTTEPSASDPATQTTQDQIPQVTSQSSDANAAASSAAESPSESEPELKTPASPPQITPTPTSLTVTILLQSGKRQEFVLNQSYLERHSVKNGSKTLTDPFEMSVWQLKECIWKDWKEDWDQRPASALFIKLIQLGAYMVDSNPLKDCRLNADSPNVIHMAIRPAEVGDDDATQRSTKGAFGHSRDRDAGRRTPSCRCVIL